MDHKTNSAQDFQNSLEERVCNLENKVQKLERDAKMNKLDEDKFNDIWTKNPKDLAYAAIIDKRFSMRHPRFVLESRLLRVTFWMMLATFAMAVATAIMAVATFLR